MPVLDEPALRFELLRCVQKLPASVLRDLVSKSPEVRDRAVQGAVEIMWQRLQHLTVTAPEPHPGMDFGGMKRGRG